MKKEQTYAALKRAEHDLLFWSNKAQQIKTWIDEKNPEHGTEFYPSWLTNVETRIAEIETDCERLRALLQL